jgi:hypothetical protein
MLIKHLQVLSSPWMLTNTHKRCIEVIISPYTNTNMLIKHLPIFNSPWIFSNTHIRCIEFIINPYLITNMFIKHLQIPIIFPYENINILIKCKWVLVSPYDITCMHIKHLCMLRVHKLTTIFMANTCKSSSSHKCTPIFRTNTYKSSLVHGCSLILTQHTCNSPSIQYSWFIFSLQHNCNKTKIHTCSHNTLINVQNKTLLFISTHHNTLVVPNNSWLFTHNMIHPLNFTRVIFQKIDLAYVKPKKYTTVHMMHICMTSNPTFIQNSKLNTHKPQMWINITWIHFKMSAS